MAREEREGKGRVVGDCFLVRRVYLGVLGKWMEMNRTEMG